MPTTKPHPCYCVFDVAGNPLWYTVRPSAGLARHVHEAATGVCWATAARRGYTVRKLKLTEVK